LGHARFEFGIPGGQFVSLAPDGVVVLLDPRQRRHAREQLALVEGFGDEVVGARLEGGQSLFGSAGGDHHDGQEFRCGSGAYPAADLVAVHLRHQNVEQHDVDVLGLQQRQCFSTRCRRHDPVAAGRENRVEQPQIGRLIVDSQDRRLDVHQVARPLRNASI
jgi:hypothetical protein